MASIHDRMVSALAKRQEQGNLRRLIPFQSKKKAPLVDFSSNDYLGLSRCRFQQAAVRKLVDERQLHDLGSTGSRLLSGNHPYCEELESRLASLHGQRAGLMFGSGYQANLSVISCLPCDTILYDSLIHNSLHMGMRWWQQRDSSKKLHMFRHNDASHLEEILKGLDIADSTVVLVESVYSMDGDVAPLQEVMDVADKYSAKVVVDEAHGFGVYGRSSGVRGTGVLAELELEQHPSLLSSVFTFGKAAGCHGAIACFKTPEHRDYVLNFGYPLIYSTAPPLHLLATIDCAYDRIIGNDGHMLRKQLRHNVKLFRSMLGPLLNATNGKLTLMDSDGAIQAIVVPGNNACTELCQSILDESPEAIRLFPIKSPTVAAGTERVRVVIHAHNTDDEILNLVECFSRVISRKIISSRL